MRRREIVMGLFTVLMALTAIATVRALWCYGTPNRIFYVACCTAAVCNLLTPACILTIVGAVVWQFMLPYLITWPGAIVTVIAYWNLFRNKRIPTAAYPTTIRRDNGMIFTCILRTSIGIPLPWRRLQIRRTGGILKVYQTSWFSRRNYAQNLASLCDPELEGNMFPHMFFGTSVLVLKEHTSKEDKLWRTFTLTNSEARFLAGEDDDEGFLDTLIRQARREKKNDEGGLYIN